MEKTIFGKSVDISQKIDHQKYNGYTFVKNDWLNLKEKYNMETDSNELSNDIIFLRMLLYFIVCLCVYFSIHNYL